MYMDTLRGLGPKSVIWVSLDVRFCAVTVAASSSARVDVSMVNRDIRATLLL